MSGIVRITGSGVDFTDHHTPVFKRIIDLERAANAYRDARRLVRLIDDEADAIEAEPWSMARIRRTGILGRWYDYALDVYDEAARDLLVVAAR